MARNDVLFLYTEFHTSAVRITKFKLGDDLDVFGKPFILHELGGTDVCWHREHKTPLTFVAV